MTPGFDGGIDAGARDGGDASDATDGATQDGASDLLFFASPPEGERPAPQAPGEGEAAILRGPLTLTLSPLRGARGPDLVQRRLGAVISPPYS